MATLGARGRLAVLADVTGGNNGNGGISQAPPTGMPRPNLIFDPSQPHFWVMVLLASATLYLFGAYVVISGYRVPL
jgi:hypothetical protein